MPTLYPAALDDFANPGPEQSQAGGPRTHSEQHADAFDAIEALQRQVGVAGSADGESIEYRLNGGVTHTAADNQLLLWMGL